MKDATALSPDLGALVERTKAAQQLFAGFSQDQVDRIFRAASLAAANARIPLARMAVEETAMGVMEDKVLKNHFASEHICNKYKVERTCGVPEEDPEFGTLTIAEPVGLICGIVPATNPTSTALFKALISLKTRNGIIFSPHPRARRSTCEAARIVHDAAVAAGAPEGVIGWIEAPTVEMSNALMRHPGINMILATGGPGMVRAACSSGKPAIGVGAGNTPAVIDEKADIKRSVASILMSKTFDNGVICASEQSTVVVDEVYDAVCARFLKHGDYVLRPEERDAVGKALMTDGHLNAAIAGQSAVRIAEMAGVTVPANATVLIGTVEEVSDAEPFARQKLSPTPGMYRVRDFDAACDSAAVLIALGGIGHTSALSTDQDGEPDGSANSATG